MLSDVDEEEEEPPLPSAVTRALKSHPVPALPSVASSSKLSFACALASSAGATSVAVVVVTASKDEEEKDGISFSSSYLPERRIG